VLVVIVAQSLNYHWRALPTSATGYFARGRGDFLAGAFDSAVANLTKSIELDPNGADSYIWRGEAYLRLHDLPRAMADFEKAVALRPAYAKAHFSHGDGFDAAWNAGAAIDEYSRALALEPDYAKCYLARGQLFYDTARWDDAAADLRKGASMLLADKQAASSLLLWLARARGGDTAGATAELKGALEARQVHGASFAAGARFLIGELTEKAYLEAMATIEDDKPDERKAEGCFIAGAKRIALGDRAGAVELLREAIVSGAEASYAYDRARAELENLLFGFHARLAAPPDAGLVIDQVANGSAADAAGIRPGAILANFGGVDPSQQNWLAFLKVAKPGSTLGMELIDAQGARNSVVFTLRLEPSVPTK
jgi:Tfp pilus assembly protein PilF